MSDAETETLTAYHEAGHALMAVVCGGRIVHVSITPPDDDGLARFGESIVQWPAAPVREIEMAELKVSLAGPIAELTYDGGRVAIGECPEFAADWQRAQLSASELKSGRQQLALLVATEQELWGFFESENIWAATAAIADLLLAHDTIEHDDVADTWQFWKAR
jgi:hypothetical protein